MKLSITQLWTGLFLAAILTACSLQQANPTADTGIVATKVAETLAAFTQSAQQTSIIPPASPSPVQSIITQTITQAPSATVVFTITPKTIINPTVTIGTTTTPIPAPGAIEGTISGYPYGSIPALAVVALKQNSATYFYVINGPGNTFYSMTDTSNKGFVATGSYQVVAYDSAGHSGGCVTMVTVVSNMVVTCNITNWGGGYPAKPSGVPNP